MSSELFSVSELLGGFALLLGANRVLLSPRIAVAKNESAISGFIVNKFNAAGIYYDYEKLKSLIGLGFLVSILIGMLFSPYLAIVAPVVSFLGLLLFLKVSASSKMKKAKMVNDEICYFLARSLRAGHGLETSLIQANSSVSGSIAISQIVSQNRIGVSLSKAVANIGLNDSFGLKTPEKMLCATISLAHEMGGNSARIFDRIGDSFHQSYELHEETQAALSQVKLSAFVIGILPVVMFAFSLLLGSDSALFLFNQPLGWLCLVLGTLLEVIGALWMRKLVKQGVQVWTF